MAIRVIGTTGIDTVSTTLTAAQSRELPIGTSDITDAYVPSVLRKYGQVNSNFVIASTTEIVSSPGGGIVQTIYLKLRGWDPLTGAFETWVSTNAESAAPSGNPLVGREIAARWVV